MRLFAIAMLSCASIFAQAVRFDNTASTVSGQVPPGALTQILAIPGTQVNFCNGNAVGTVSTAATVVTWVSGPTFTGITGSIQIAGKTYTVKVVVSSTVLNLTQTAGTQTAVPYSSLSGCLANPVTTYTDAGAGTSCPPTAQLTPQLGGSCVSVADNQGNYGGWFLPFSGYYYLRTPASAGGVTSGPYPISIGASAGCLLGTVCDANYDTLALACTAAGSGTLYITRVWNATPTQSLGCGLTFLGNGKIVAATSATVAFTGNVTCPQYQQCFDSTTNSGASMTFTKFPSNGNPSQWGAAGDGSTNDTAKIVAASNAACSSASSTDPAVLSYPKVYAIAPTVAANPILPSCSNSRLVGPGGPKIMDSAGSFYSIWGTSAAPLSNVRLDGLAVDYNSSNNALVSCPDLATYPRILFHSGPGGTNNSAINLTVTGARAQWGIFMKSSHSSIVNTRWTGVGGGSVACDSSLLYMDPGANGGLAEGNQVSATAPNTNMAVTAIEVHDNVLVTGNTSINMVSGIIGAEGANTVGQTIVGNRIVGTITAISLFSNNAFGASGCGISNTLVADNDIVVNQLSYLGASDAGYGVRIDDAGNLPICNLAIKDNRITFDVSTGAGDDYNITDRGIGYVQSNAGGGCQDVNISGNTIKNAPLSGIRMSCDGGNIAIKNNVIVDPGSTLNPAVNSSFRPGIFLSNFSSPFTGQKDFSGNSINDDFATCRFGYGIELATLNTSGIIIDGVSVSAEDATCASLVKAVTPNTTTQVPYIRAILNVPAAAVLPVVASAPNSTFESIQEGVEYTWNGAVYSFVVPHPGTPTIGAGCGSGATINAGSTDRIGRLTIGTGTVTSCIINWSKAFTTANPIVFEQLGSNIGSPTLGAATSNTTLFSINGANLAGNIIIWSVPGGQN